MKDTDSANQQPTAKELISANIQALMEQLQQGHSEAFTAYLAAMGRFHRYSFGNILEIARQRPDATRVAGIRTWNEFGRRVVKGEKGIRIFAPMVRAKRESQETAEAAQDGKRIHIVTGFRAAYVFERLSRDLRPGFCAPDVACDAPQVPTMANLSLLNLTAPCNHR